MKKHYISLLIIALAVFFSFCKKKQEDKWKMPSSVKFTMDINRESAMGGNLAFTGGNIILNYFSFDGKRDQGGDVYFDNSSAINYSFDSNATIPEWNFDIPQGSYSQIKIMYKTGGSQNDKQIVVTGTYTNSTNSTVYPVRFEFQANQTFLIFAKAASGNSQIVLDKDVEAIAKIEMDPVYWFQVITPAMMDNANITNLNGTPTLLINKNTNNNINNAMQSRVHDNVTRVTFN